MSNNDIVINNSFVEFSDYFELPFSGRVYYEGESVQSCYDRLLNDDTSKVITAIECSDSLNFTDLLSSYVRSYNTESNIKEVLSNDAEAQLFAGKYWGIAVRTKYSYTRDGYTPEENADELYIYCGTTTLDDKTYYLWIDVSDGWVGYACLTEESPVELMLVQSEDNIGKYFENSNLSAWQI